MKLIALTLGAGLLLSANVQETTLRLKPKKNAVFTYTTISDVSSSATSSPNAQRSHITTSMKVISSTKDEVRLLTTIDDIKSEARGAADAKAMKITYVLTPLWQFKDVTAEGGGPSGQILVNSLKAGLQISPVFPEKAVKPGDEWTIDLDLAQLFASMYDSSLKVKGEAKAPMKIKFVGIETKDGVKLAVLEATMDSTFTLQIAGRDALSTWKIESSAQFDLANGMAVDQKVTQTQSIDVPGSRKLNIVTKTTTTLDSVK